MNLLIHRHSPAPDFLQLSSLLESLEKKRKTTSGHKDKDWNGFRYIRKRLGISHLVLIMQASEKHVVMGVLTSSSHFLRPLPGNQSGSRNRAKRC